MAGRVPDESEVLGYFKSLSNWGRWGADDELGTLNLVTPEKRVSAVGLVKDGVTVSCARPIVTDAATDVTFQPQRYMVESGDGWAGGEKLTNSRSQSSMEFIGMVFHGQTITHVDSLCHVFWEAQMYNGRPSHLVSTRLGATAETIEVLQNGVVTRGVLLDVPKVRGIDWLEPDEGAFPEDLDAAEKACGVRVEEGDVLLIRTGHYKRRTELGPFGPEHSGPHVACLPWLRQRGVAMLGSDTSNDVAPSLYENLVLPVHQMGIVGMGLWLIDNCNLEELAQACQERNRWEFLLVIGPLRIRNGTGSPVNPIAVF